MFCQQCFPHHQLVPFLYRWGFYDVSIKERAHGKHLWYMA